ncbi:hypothetical protein TDB9533_02560 [Thalassocella blandensis]|nr:hypothetical protein TDB9533_02560 [Thalassocella blandensis]
MYTDASRKTKPSRRNCLDFIQRTKINAPNVCILNDPAQVIAFKNQKGSPQQRQPPHSNKSTASTQLLKRLAGCISETVGGRTPTSSVHGSIRSEFHLCILSGSWHHLQNSNKNNNQPKHHPHKKTPTPTIQQPTLRHSRD